MSIQNKLKEFMQGKIEAQKAAGTAFMTENRMKSGVKELPEGIQYEVIKEGSGDQPL
ncbi:MAG TPA: FKBP-type peptidyl-prolyl cis-trans isomerase N-terminal domain-containing protein, partial [Chitinophagaceae bacterium]|nr:FKBP-type peptidyl-prolyl cis-trans isomerase N-terminal domain-containing protein [Chitinophagaceae bacterium]